MQRQVEHGKEMWLRMFCNEWNTFNTGNIAQPA